MVPLWFRIFTRRRPGTAQRLSIALAHLCYQDGPDSPARTARCLNTMLALGLPEADGNRILHSYRSKVWITSPNEGDSEPLTGGWPAPASWWAASNRTHWRSCARPIARNAASTTRTG